MLIHNLRAQLHLLVVIVHKENCENIFDTYANSDLHTDFHALVNHAFVDVIRFKLSYIETVYISDCVANAIAAQYEPPHPTKCSSNRVSATTIRISIAIL